ncbi:PAS domain-containing sensor histidine kinase [Rufibacter hautae]|uniref:histidine kinase n=1 Tax=Rufibacter hautae TaxID=2595005 RepID=A0A5B6THK2_9BACT|nr:PAS domain-containing sensor histidine kinase [Rufibacter hautae]KAA3438670.1 PAS domain-containing sensor histidine kinase [Rufibacter hautae]
MPQEQNLSDRLLKYAPDMLCCVDKEGRFVKVVGACKRILGYEGEELEGRPYLDFVLPEDRYTTLQTAQKVMAGQRATAFGNRYIRKEGEVQGVVWSAEWSTEENLMFCSAREATHMEREMEGNVQTATNSLLTAKTQLEKLSLVASRSNNGVLIIDKNGIIEWVNDGFTRLHGFTLEEAVGRKPSELLHHPKMDSSIYPPIEEKLLRGESATFEVLNRKKDGEGLWVSVEINPAFSDTGELARMVVIQTDITALKYSELELSKLTKDLYRQNSDLQQFTYIVSHNLRAPVANVMGLTELLTTVSKDSETFDTSLAYLRQVAFRLDTVLKDMNTILSIRNSADSLKRELVDITSIIQQVLAACTESLQNLDATIAVEIEEGQLVLANKAYLYSIFYNLVSNAIKYRSLSRPLKIRIKCFVNSERGTLLSFSDNGTGFDMEKAKGHVFKMYKRFHATQEGRGLGLYLVKNHLDTMGGHIEVTSSPGKGTRFLMYLAKS